MKKILLCAFFIFFVYKQAGSTVPLTAVQKEAEMFIKKMYSYTVNVFEGREFNGKDNPKRHCLIMRAFFNANLLTPEDRRWHGCEIAVDAFIRYPGLGSDQIDMYGGPSDIPKIEISVPVVENDRASVAVVSKFGRTVFFLAKTDKGLRVENALYYQDWPVVDGKCWSKFLITPNAWHKKAEQAVCRQ